MATDSTPIPTPSAVEPNGSTGLVARAVDAARRIPLPVVAGMLVLGALLASLQMVWISHISASGDPEPPQWLARLTVMQCNILIPVGLIALWARRRSSQRRLGAVAAAMMAVLPVLHVVLTVGAIVWGGLLGRGDMTYPFMYIEALMFVSLAGVVVSGVAWTLDRGAPRSIGVLIVVGLVLNYVVPWGMTVVYVVLAVVLVRTGLVRRNALSDTPSSVR